MTVSEIIHKPLSEETRERLLYAAGEVFAEHGFRSATVREICRRAKVNLASVNYHFSSKEELYTAVLDYAYQQASRKYPHEPKKDINKPPEHLLYDFIRNFLLRILDEGRPAWYGKLMAREIVEPTGALERIIDTGIRPLHEHLASIVRTLLGNRGNKEEISRCILSIIGQCLFYRHGRPIISRLYPGLHCENGIAGIDRTAAHITEFTLSALKNFPKSPAGSRR